MSEVGTRLDGTVVRTAAEQLLRDHPEAVMAAVDRTGFFVPVPGSVPITSHFVFEGRSLVDHVVPDDFATVVNAWTEALAVGASVSSVRLRNDPERWMQAYMGDTRDAWGVLVCIVTPTEVAGQDEPMIPLSGELGRSRSACLHYDALAQLLWCDEGTLRMFGFPADEFLGTQASDHIHPDDQPIAITAWMEMLGSRRPRVFRARHRRADGSWLWIESTLQNMLGLPDSDYVLSDTIDVSDEMAALEALRAREEMLDRLAAAMPIGLFQIDRERRIVYANDRLHQLLGVGACATVDEVLAPLTAVHRAAFEQAMAATIHAEFEPDFELSFTLPAGEERRAAVNLRPLHDADGKVSGAIACLSDITDSTRLRLELEDRATFDPLTRCHNRGAIMKALARALESSSTDTAVIFLDLDKFKPVNDRMGHLAGDRVLMLVADRLRSVLRTDDIVGRIGGDEFLVLCRNVDGPATAMAMAGRVGRAVAGDVVLDTGTVTLAASIGVAISTPGMTADALVGRADEAMYEAKRAALGAPVLFGADLDPEADPDEGRERRHGEDFVSSD